jgi:hypothetical protein
VPAEEQHATVPRRNRPENESSGMLPMIINDCRCFSSPLRTRAAKMACFDERRAVSCSPFWFFTLDLFQA